MKGHEFWDSNLWLYLFLASEKPEDIRKKGVLIEKLRVPAFRHVSAQVLNETVNVLLKKYGVSPQDAALRVKQIISLSVVHPLSSQITTDALELQRDFRFSWFDSLIVASAQAAKCHILYSEDMQHGLKVGDLIILNPFVEQY